MSVSAVLTAGGLLAGAALLARVRTPGPPGSMAGARVSVVVPARDEAARLPVLLRSLQALDPPAHEVLVVDDDSADATAAVAADGGATVLPAPPLPPGWLGKPWACHVGAGASTGTHLLFLDADTWLAPDALARLVPALRGGLVSVQPHHDTRRAHEQLSAFPNLVAMMGTGVFSPWPGPTRPAAYGPCLLTRRGDYAAAGGHASVRGEVIEDLHLARRYAAAGLPVVCLAGGETVRFRMYPAGIGQLVEGWTKNLAAGAAGASPWAVAGTVWFVAAAGAVATGTASALAGWFAGGGFPAPALAGWVVTAAELHWLLRRIGRFRWWTAAAFPVPLAAFMGLFARSGVRTLLGRPATWRGRLLDPRGGA